MVRVGGGGGWLEKLGKVGKVWINLENLGQIKDIHELYSNVCQVGWSDHWYIC